MKMTIRQATEADIPLLAEIGRQTFFDAFGDKVASQEDFEKYLAKAFSIQQISDEYHTNTNLFLLAENENGEALAYAKLRWDGRRDDLMPHTDYVEVQRIYVQRNYWRMGIGKLMMKEILDLARKRGYKCVCLSVYEENIPAIRFYEQFGFQKIGKVEFKIEKIIEYDMLMSVDL